ncbi:MAG: 4Fe-4S binding protein [Armatimonadetes bacterium]|nr:4Fe-4S binding protein [Armatimonadota bacterium]
MAQIDREACIGCGKCVTACPAQAIALGPDRKARVSANLCRGCAVCVAQCPVNAITMVSTQSPS